MYELNLDRALEIQQSMPKPELHDLPWLAVHARDCEAILEIGCFRGASTRAMLDNSNAHIWCLDSWKGSGRTDSMKGLVTTEHDYQCFLRNLEDALNRITILKMFTYEAVERGVLEGLTFDMVFIDGDHSYEAVKFDIEHFGPLVRPGGLLCGHDYESRRRKGLVKAVHEMAGTPNIGGDQIWWVVKDG